MSKTVKANLEQGDFLNLNTAWGLDNHPRTLAWYGVDSPIQSLKQQGARALEPSNITYQLNSQGYRTREFLQVRWDQTLAVVGCSHVFGLGVPEDQTLPYWLETLLAVPTLNLGMTSASAWLCYINCLALIARRPRAILMVWPQPERIPQFYDQPQPAVRDLGMERLDREFLHLGAWSDSSLFREWNRSDSQSCILTLTLAQSLRIMCSSNGIPLCEASYSDICETLNCLKLEFLDRARDGIHPGPQSHRSAAEQIADLLLKLLP